MDAAETKTKKKIKQAFLNELSQKQFEAIHVADVCRQAHVSRVTFYNWYADKFELLDDIFQDFIERIRKEMEQRQAENNPQDDPIQGYINLLDVILISEDTGYVILKRAEENKDSWLYYYYYTSILNGIETLMSRYSGRISPRFASRQTAAFICGGLWDFIRTCRQEKLPQDEIRRQAESLLTAILKSDAFRK